MKLNAKLLYGAVAALVIGLVYLYISNNMVERFAPAPGSAALTQIHNQVPPVDPQTVVNIKQGIRNTIQARPDLVNALKDVVSDPEIRPVVQDIFGQGAGADAGAGLYGDRHAHAHTHENDYAKPCGCPAENDCDCDY
jgi:hypothetical protein